MVPNESLSIRIVKTCLSKSESTYVLYNITLTAKLRYLNRFCVENNVCGVFNLRFLSLQAMSLKKCRALIRHLFLETRLLNRTQRSFERLGCIAASLFKPRRLTSCRINVQAHRFFAASFRHRGRLLCILPKKEPQPVLRLSIIHLQARAHAAPRLSKKRFESAFRRISANH